MLINGWGAKIVNEMYTCMVLCTEDKCKNKGEGNVTSPFLIPTNYNVIV
jgi:hypothetical protein